MPTTQEMKPGQAAGMVDHQGRCLPAALKLLAMARDDMATGRVQPLDGLKDRIRARAVR